jgi:hypothetical protein
MQTTLLRDARGETGGSYLILIGAVALVGLGAFSGLGGAFDTAIGSDTNGGVPVTVMAGMAGEAPAAPPPSTQAGGGGGGGGNVTVVTVEAGTGGGRSSVWGDTNGDGVLSDAEARAAAASLAGGLSDKFESKGGGCSGFSLCHVTNAAKSVARNPVVRGIGNFANNMGLNPVQMLTDPIGYAKGTWNRGWGVGQFVVGTGKGLYTLVENGSELFNPLDPRFARELLTDPKGLLDRRVGVAKEAWRLAPGVANLAWEMSPAGMGYDLLTGGPDKFLADRKKYGEQLWENPMTQSLVEPWKACAGEPSAAAQNACGQVATDIAITILTGGAGKGARGAGLVDDMARVASHGDDVARVVSHTDELADAGNVASKVDEVGDAARVGDDAARVGDDAVASADDIGRGDEFPNCRNGVCTNGACFTAGTPVSVGGETHAIETVSAGMRVDTLATSPAYVTAVSSTTHMLYSFEMANPEIPGSVIELETIRRAGTYDESLVGTTATVPLAFAEWGVSGDAHLTQVSAAPAIAAGEGFVVLSTFRRESSDVYSLSFTGSDETLEPTGTHRFWSVDRADWVATRDLREGERLRTEAGEVAVEGIEQKPGTHTVFNFEVEQEHTYLVGGLGVWTHNDCPNGKNTPTEIASPEGTRPPDLSPPGAGRRGAFNEAKRQSGIPTSQQPSRVLPNINKQGKIVEGRVYEFEVATEGGGVRTIRIRDDAGGHFYKDDPLQNRGPHFNDEAGNHFDY